MAETQNTPVSLATLRENAGARPKRQRIGRGHGSGMVKTGGEGGKGQTVRSGGGKGPAFEGGQTPWARRLPHNRGYSQKGRDTGHFGVEYAVVNLSSLADWDPSVEITPLTLKAARLVRVRSEAQKRIYEIDPDGIEAVAGWAEGVRRHWAAKLDVLEADLRRET